MYSVKVKDEDSTTSVNDVLNKIQEAVSNGSLGNFSVDTSYPICQRDIQTEDCVVSNASSSTPFPTSTSSVIDSSIFSSEFATTSIVESSSSDMSSVSESSIAPSVTETEVFSSSIIPEVGTVEVVSSLKLEETYREDLSNDTSPQFKAFEQEFCEEVNVFYIVHLRQMF